MRKLRVGIWLSKDINPQVGGGFGYYGRLLQAILVYQFEHAAIYLLSNDGAVNEIDFPRKYNLSFVAKNDIITNGNSKRSFFKKISSRPTPKAQERDLIDELQSMVDVIYYPTNICAFSNFPYLLTVWDMGHLSSYAFPELSMNRVYEIRQESYADCARKALLILAESKAGKKQLQQLLNIPAHRVGVVPLFASGVAEHSVVAKAPADLAPDMYFVHYPAQYWAHKNHFHLLLAFKKLLHIYPHLKLILTGSDKGNKKYIQEFITELDLKEKVIDLGFASIEELKWLYLHSKALVMPTLLGPTNMPLLEAAELGCPVACSDFDGHREQLGDYARYFDPFNVDSMVLAIKELLNDNSTRQPYSNPFFQISQTLKNLDEAFEKAAHLRFCWGVNQNII